MAASASLNCAGSNSSKIRASLEVPSQECDLSTQRGEAHDLAWRIAQRYGDYIVYMEQQYKLPREEAIKRAQQDLKERPGKA